MTSLLVPPLFWPSRHADPRPTSMSPTIATSRAGSDRPLSIHYDETHQVGLVHSASRVTSEAEPISGHVGYAQSNRPRSCTPITTLCDEPCHQHSIRSAATGQSPPDFQPCRRDEPQRHAQSRRFKPQRRARSFTATNVSRQYDFPDCTDLHQCDVTRLNKSMRRSTFARHRPRQRDVPFRAILPRSKTTNPTSWRPPRDVPALSVLARPRATIYA